ncbi:glutathione S-transferase N-terminal domain-containing protein [Cupriavidus sp. 2KB_3]|uniref:glutathione S-transferase N-terminal domain-containing protein n=1 Tax=Cupriavidus sp. 2KB_3 TaxID=3232980 RepID=UPI003F902320
MLVQDKTSAPLDFYYWPTPNGQKVAIFLEESSLPYRLHPTDISRGAQHSAAFTQISPNNRIPAIVDNTEGISLFESGAILLYLAERSRDFISMNVADRVEVLKWLFWQMAGLGPTLGHTVFFRNYAPEPSPLATQRFSVETARLYGVLDRQLAHREFIAGAYSISDMATFPWILQHDKQGLSLAGFPHVKRWLHTVQARPAVQRAYDLGERVRPCRLTDQNRAALFTLNTDTTTNASAHRG